MVAGEGLVVSGSAESLELVWWVVGLCDGLWEVGVEWWEVKVDRCLSSSACHLLLQLDPDFWNAALTCKEGDWLREPVKTQWGWHLIMVQARITKKRK